MPNGRKKTVTTTESMENGYRKRLEDKHFTYSLQENVMLIRELFRDVDLMQYRALETEGGYGEFYLIWADGVVDSARIDEYIIKPIFLSPPPAEDKAPLDFLVRQVLQINGIQKSGDIFEIVKALSYGECLLLMEGEQEGLLLDTKGFTTRGIAEPDGEKILSGPREGFSESLMQNLSLLRRKLRTSELKLKYYSLGQRSNTQLCIAYMDGLMKQEILDELYERLGKVDIDAVLDANYLNELIRDNRRSLFRSTGYTERPDIIAAKLLEGRIAIFVDGSPVVLTIPYLFVENFQSNEDYYTDYQYGTIARLLRIFGFFLAIIIPGLYVAILSFHQEMLPTILLIRIAVDSRNVPFPTFLETFALLIMFDVLREAGIRMPTGVGQALSIVGALVVGSAAVEADLVSANVIIVTAASGITSLLVSKLNAAIPIVRNLLLFLSAALGFYGLILGLVVLCVHMLKLESFGVPQVGWDTTLRYQNVKDTFVRGPFWSMIERPNGLSKDKVRMHPPKGGSS